MNFKKFVESYRCRICKIPLTLDNFGGLGENHMIFCKNCALFMRCNSFGPEGPPAPLGAPLEADSTRQPAA